MSDAVIAPPGIASEHTLRVGVDSSHAPFAGSAGNDIIGIDIDIAAALAEQMGLNLVPVDVKGQDVGALLRAGEIDVAMGIQPDAAADFSEAQVGPYLVDGPAVFTVGLSDTPQSFDPAQLNGMKVVAQEGSLSAWQVGKDYGDDSLVTYPSLTMVFEELSNGVASYAAADAIVGSFLAVQYENVRCEGMLSEPKGVYMGVATDKQELATKLTEALRGLRDGGTIQIIVAKWLGPVSAQTVLSAQAIMVDPAAGTSAEGAGPTTGTSTEDIAPAAEGMSEDSGPAA
jgi:polar amino acid transport system substrate-binding protein